MRLPEAANALDRVPVAVLTGFLGSGKTTLLNGLLRDPDLADTAVIINEFGEVGIDHLLVDMVDGELLLLKSGCICCTVRADLEGALLSLLARRDAGAVPHFSRVIIETTGLADPAPILQMLLNYPELTPLFRLDGVTTAVDAIHGAQQLDAHPEAVKQVAVADRLVLTKTDIENDTAALSERLARINPTASQLRIRYGAVTAEALFGATPYDPSRLSDWLGANAAHDDDDHHGHDHHHEDVNRHDDRIQASVLVSPDPVNWTEMEAWFADVGERHGPSMLRVKGILNVAGEDQPVVVHGVHHVFHEPARLPHWPDDDRRSRLVFILRDLDVGAVSADIPGKWVRVSG